MLAFLPGWEGRYYWQYGDYRPEPRLGGVTGFRALAEGARRLGVTLMPMFGANCANTGLPGFEQWGSAVAAALGGRALVFQGNRPDWDASRAHDPGWQAWLNPGAPGLAGAAPGAGERPRGGVRPAGRLLRHAPLLGERPATTRCTRGWWRCATA